MRPLPVTSLALSLSLTVSLVVTASSPALAGVVPERERRAPVHTVGGCELFPPDNPWNRRIDSRPVWRHSAAIVGRQAAGHDLHLDLGTTEEYYGIPVNVVSKLHDRGRNEWLFAPVTPYDSWAAYGTSKLALVHEAAEVQRV